MNEHIIFGLFAMYVAGISLAQVLSGQQDALLAHLRRTWGRRIGHSLYFLSYVAVPLLICVLCLGWGIRQYDPDQTVMVGNSQIEPLRLDVESFRELRSLFPQELPFELNSAIYGA